MPVTMLEARRPRPRRARPAPRERSPRRCSPRSPSGGEQAVRDYALSARQMVGRDRGDAARRSSGARAHIPEGVKADIAFATGQVRALRRGPARSIADFSVESIAGPGRPARSSCPSTSPAATCRPAATPTSPRPTCRSRPPRRPACKTVIACSTPFRGEGIHPLRALRDEGGRRRHHHDARRRAGDRGDGASGCSPASPPTSSSGPATSSSPRPSACCSARSASTSSPAPPRWR